MQVKAEREPLTSIEEMQAVTIESLWNADDDGKEEVVVKTVIKEKVIRSRPKRAV